MRCKNCGTDIDKKWEYCPKCGNKIKTSFLGLGNVFSFNPLKLIKNMESDFKDLFNKEAVEMDNLKGFFDNPRVRTSGIKIKISNGEDGNPRFEVKRLGGDEDKDEVKQKKLKIKSKPSLGRMHDSGKKTKEPVYRMFKSGSGLIIEIELPEVTSINDIIINEFEESIEIKAYTKDAIYFKILAIPQMYKLSRKNLSNGTLTLTLFNTN